MVHDLSLPYANSSYSLSTYVHKSKLEAVILAIFPCKTRLLEAEEPHGMGDALFAFVVPK